jgi:large repetitive protein
VIRPPAASGCTQIGNTSGQITFNWSGGSGNGRPASYETSVDGGGWSNQGTVPNGGSTTRTYACSSSHTVRVRITRTIDGGTQFSGMASFSSTLPTAPRNPPAVGVSWGASAQGQPTCSSTFCHYVHITLDHFTATTSYACRLTTGHGDVRNYSLRTDGTGHYSGDQPFYYGYRDWVRVDCGGVTGEKNPWA